MDNAFNKLMSEISLITNEIAFNKSTSNGCNNNNNKLNRSSLTLPLSPSYSSTNNEDVRGFE